MQHIGPVMMTAIGAISSGMVGASVTLVILYSYRAWKYRGTEFGRIAREVVKTHAVVFIIAAPIMTLYLVWGLT